MWTDRRLLKPHTRFPTAQHHEAGNENLQVHSAFVSRTRVHYCVVFLSINHRQGLQLPYDTAIVQLRNKAHFSLLVLQVGHNESYLWTISKMEQL